jgi:VWFA-related protein
VVLALCATALPASQGRQDQAPPPAPPAYYASVSLVLVDVRVARGGEPVADLRTDDLTLLVDGKPRTITSLIYAPVVVPGHKSPDASATTAARAAAPTGAAPARRLVFVVDRNSIAPGEARQLQKTTEDFIGRVPRTIATAVATLPLESDLRFDPDRSRVVQHLREAFEGTTRRGSGFESIAGFGCSDEAASEGCGNQGLDPKIPVGPARETNRAAEWTLRGRRTLADLQRLFRTLAGTPSDVVIISGGLPFYEGRTSGRPDDPFPEGVTAGMRADIDRTFAVARAAGTRVHAIEIRDLTRAALPQGGNLESLDLAALRERRPAGYGLPEETGGVAVTGAVSGASFFDRLATELSSTYLLSFEPTEADRDGKPHAIEIRTGRPGLTIVARKTFVALPGAPLSVPTPGAVVPGEAAATITPTSGSPIPRPTARPTSLEAWVALAQAHVPGERERFPVGQERLGLSYAMAIRGITVCDVVDVPGRQTAAAIAAGIPDDGWTTVRWGTGTARPLEVVSAHASAADAGARRPLAALRAVGRRHAQVLRPASSRERRAPRPGGARALSVPIEQQCRESSP